MSETQIGDFVHDLGEAARRNPLSAALIGAGVVWFLAGNKAATVPMEVGRRVGDFASDAVDLASRGFQSGSDSLSSGISAGQNAIASGATSVAKAVDEGRASLSQTLDQHVDGFRDWSSDSFDNVRDNLATLLREQPIALGALGIVVGATIAASLPISNNERDHLGEAAKTAGSVVGHAVGDLMKRGENAINAITDEMQTQGLTTENVRGTVEDVVTKAKNTISSLKNDQKTPLA